MAAPSSKFVCYLVSASKGERDGGKKNTHRLGLTR